MIDSSRRRSVIGIVVVVALAAVLVPAWLWWAGLRATLEVHAETGVPECEGTRPTTVDASDLGDEGFRRIGIPMNAGFRCTLRLKVDNDSGRTVTLGRMAIPIAGPGGGPGFEVTFVDGQAVPDDDAVEAAVDLDIVLDAGDSAVIPVVVAFREDGCDSEGGGSRVWPTIRVRSTLGGSDLTIVDFPTFLGTKDSSCDG